MRESYRNHLQRHHDFSNPRFLKKPDNETKSRFPWICFHSNFSLGISNSRFPELIFVSIGGSRSGSSSRKVGANENSLVLFFADFFRSPPLTVPGSPRMRLGKIEKKAISKRKKIISTVRESLFYKWFTNFNS